MNLLELPVLFYAICLAVYVTHRVDPLDVGLAWGFLALRVAHSLVHLGYNNVRHRLVVFGIGNVVLLANRASRKSSFLRCGCASCWTCCIPRSSLIVLA